FRRRSCAPGAVRRCPSARHASIVWSVMIGAGSGSSCSRCWHSRPGSGAPRTGPRRTGGTPVSPDEQVIGTIVRRATRRVRLLAIAEAIAIGVAAAASSRMGGLVAAIAYVAWRWRDSRRDSVVEDAEQSHPELRNLLVTWKEISEGTLHVTPSARARVMVKAASRARLINLARVVPATRLVQVMVVA